MCVYLYVCAHFWSFVRDQRISVCLWFPFYCDCCCYCNFFFVFCLSFFSFFSCADSILVLMENYEITIFSPNWRLLFLWQCCRNDTTQTSVKAYRKCIWLTEALTIVLPTLRFMRDLRMHVFPTSVLVVSQATKTVSVVVVDFVIVFLKRTLAVSLVISLKSSNVKFWKNNILRYWTHGKICQMSVCEGRLEKASLT